MTTPEFPIDEPSPGAPEPTPKQESFASRIRKRTAVFAAAWLLAGAALGGGVATAVEAHGSSSTSTTISGPGSSGTRPTGGFPGGSSSKSGTLPTGTFPGSSSTGSSSTSSS